MNEIICGDCLEIMKRYKDNSIDCIITDPPYGVNFCSNHTNRKDYIKNDSFKDWLDILPHFLKEFKRVLTGTGCCCFTAGGGKTPTTAIFTLEAIKYFNLIQTLVWRKFIGLGWRYRPAYENILILSKSKDKYAFYDESKKCANVIEGINQEIPRTTKQGLLDDEHPTKKPEALMRHLIQIHSKPNDLILDPFMGSGTTCVAAKQLGRRYIGIDIEKRYCEIAERRLAQDYLF